MSALHLQGQGVMGCVLWKVYLGTIFLYSSVPDFDGIYFSM